MQLEEWEYVMTAYIATVLLLLYKIYIWYLVKLGQLSVFNMQSLNETCYSQYFMEMCICDNAPQVIYPH